MATYRVNVTASAQKALGRLPREVQARIARRLRRLAKNPRDHDCVKMKGHANEYRTRVRDYRIRYLIEDDVLVVLVVEIAHRRDVYRLF